MIMMTMMTKMRRWWYSGDDDEYHDDNSNDDDDDDNYDDDDDDDDCFCSSLPNIRSNPLVTRKRNQQQLKIWSVLRTQTLFYESCNFNNLHSERDQQRLKIITSCQSQNLKSVANTMTLQSMIFNDWTNTAGIAWELILYHPSVLLSIETKDVPTIRQIHITWWIVLPRVYPAVLETWYISLKSNFTIINKIMITS